MNGYIKTPKHTVFMRCRSRAEAVFSIAALPSELAEMVLYKLPKCDVRALCRRCLQIADETTTSLHITATQSQVPVVKQCRMKRPCLEVMALIRLSNLSLEYCAFGGFFRHVVPSALCMTSPWLLYISSNCSFV